MLVHTLEELDSGAGTMCVPSQAAQNTMFMRDQMQQRRARHAHRCFTRQLRHLARLEDADTPHKLVAAVCRHETKYRELAQREGHSFDDVRWFTGELRNVARWWKNAKARGAPVQQ